MSNTEKYLAALASGDTTDLPTPISRQDFYLAKMCGMDVPLPAPISRNDVYLKYLAENGGGGDLPALVNAALAGDILADKEAIDGNGQKITGTMPDNGTVTAKLTVDAPEYTIPAGKHSGAGKVSVDVEEKSVTPTTEAQEVTPSEGKVLGKVTVGAAQGEDFEITNCVSLFENNARLDSLTTLWGHIPYISNASAMFRSCDTDSFLDLFDVISETDFVQKLKKSEICSFMFSMSRPIVHFPSISFENDGVWLNDMFESATRLVSVGDIFSPSSGTNGLQTMFSYASSLTTVGSITIGDNDVVTYTASMFYGCRSLKNVGTMGFRPVKAFSMFSGCVALEAVPAMDLSECIDISNMFNGCKALRGTINFGKTKVGSSVSGAFSGCVLVEEILDFYVGGNQSVNGSNCFPKGTSLAPAALKRLTFHAETALTGFSYLDIRYCSFVRAGMVEFFNSLPDITQSAASSSYKTITITGNPCITGTLADGTACDTLTDEDRAIATSKGWTLVE